MADDPRAILADLARAFPRQQVTPDQFGKYLRELDDVPADVLDRACRDLVRTSEFYPTVRAIRERAAEMVLALPGEADALSQVEARMAWGRSDESVRTLEPPVVHPIVRAALDHVGGYHAFRAADEPAVVRGQFLRLYRELRAAAILDAQTGAVPLTSAAVEGAMPLALTTGLSC